MINAIVIAALMASPVAAAPERCLTRQEAGDIALTAASIGLGALAERCRPHVGKSAFLNGGAGAMLTRMRAAAEPRRNSAFAAFARMSRPSPATAAEGGEASGAGAEAGAADAETASAGNTERTGSSPENSDLAMPVLDPSANPELMAGFVTVMAAAMISSIDTAACADANDFIEALAPLPPENIARLAGAGLGIAGTARPTSANNPLCPA